MTLGGDSIVRWILKPGTVVLMIILAATTDTSEKPYRNLLVAGLACSALGDIFLLAKGSQWFMFGLIAFLIAHLVYVSAFSQRWRFNRTHVVSFALVAAYAFLLLRGLHAGVMVAGGSGLWIPVVVYVTVISLMVLGAVGTGNRVAMVGAVLFLLSDSLLAWNKFVVPISWAGYGVMITYYLAQYCLAASIRNGGGQRAERGK